VVRTWSSWSTNGGERVAATTSRDVRRPSAEDGAPSPAQVAWLAALPVALLTVALAGLLGPPLGDALLGPGEETFWRPAEAIPEPAEHGRYVLSLAGPALLAAAVLTGLRQAFSGVSAATLRRCALAAQVALIAFVAICFAAQNELLLSAYRPETGTHARYFTPATLLVALLAPPLTLALLRRKALARHLGGLARETPARRAAAAGLAVALLVAWLLTAVFTDGSVAHATHGVIANIPWSMAEPFAILNGHTPLADFHPQYAQLLPYLAAGAMALFGASIGTYTIAMAALSGLALLAVYALLRRIVRGSLPALALWAPFVATSFFMEAGPLANRFSPANLYSIWPIRCSGPYVLAWLLVRHLDGAAPRRTWLLFAAGGLVLVNNPEFGLGALAGVAVALALARPPHSRAAWGRSAAEALGGLALALAAVTLATLARSGTAPHFGWVLEFAKLYGADGWAMIPLPSIGLYLAMYVTFAAAIALAVVRRARDDADTVLTGALAWSGTFGLLAGSYYVGRSHPTVLIDLFSPWALALGLLTVASVRTLAARGWREPSPAELAVLFGFALTTCSLAQTPTPWGQLARIRNAAPVAILKQAASSAFVAERTRPGEKVMILIPLGHRIAYDTGRVNVLEYASIQPMPTREQLERAIATLRREGGDKAFISSAFTEAPELAALQRAGFVARGEVAEGGSAVVELVDRGG
jgi:hypothetical protein